MNTLNTSSYKTRFIGFLLIVSGFISLVKSDNNFYTLSNLPSSRDQVENSLNIPGVPENYFTFSRLEISVNRASDVPIILYQSHFDIFKTFPQISYNNYVSVQLKSAEHFFITSPIIKLLHKSIVCQSSEEDPFLS